LNNQIFGNIFIGNLISGNHWLEGLAISVDFTWLSLLDCGIMVLGRAVVTVSYQTFKAAIVNPSQSLNYE